MTKERLDIAVKLIELVDRNRAIMAARVALTLSTDAVLLGVTLTLLLHNSRSWDPNDVFKMAALLSLVVTALLLLASAFFAISAVTNVWKFSRDFLPVDYPDRTPWNPRDAIRLHKTLTTFEKQFMRASFRRVTSAALAEVWSSMEEQTRRYWKLRWALRFALIAVVPFVIGITLSIVSEYTLKPTGVNVDVLNRT